MLPEPDVIRLHHMLDASQEALDFARGKSRADLDSNPMLCRALVRDIEVVGEAASKVSPETRESLSVIPWASVVSMRNRLIHGYFDIDLDRVWDTVTDDLPHLVADLTNIIDNTAG